MCLSLVVSFKTKWLILSLQKFLCGQHKHSVLPWGKINNSYQNICYTIFFTYLITLYFVQNDSASTHGEKTTSCKLYSDIFIWTHSGTKTTMQLGIVSVVPWSSSFVIVLNHVIMFILSELYFYIFFEISAYF